MLLYNWTGRVGGRNANDDLVAPTRPPLPGKIEGIRDELSSVDLRDFLEEKQQEGFLLS
jgi:hypothetical protein